MGDLTKHFSLWEIGGDAIPPDILPSFTHGLLVIMEPISERYRKTIRITSGWRSETHNADPKVGGSKTSQHLGLWHGEPSCAFDIEDWHTGLIDELWPLCVEMGGAREFPFDQLINERGKIHVGLVLTLPPRYQIKLQKIDPTSGDFTYETLTWRREAIPQALGTENLKGTRNG